MVDDPRMQVVLGLMPADAVFIVRRGYVAGATDEPCPSCDADSGVCVDPLLWRPEANGYVSEYNPWQAGLYTGPKGYKPQGVDPEAHSYVVPVSEYMGGVRVQDDTPVAVLVDEILRLRVALDNAQAFIDGGTKMSQL